MYWTAMRLVMRVVDLPSRTGRPAHLAVACAAAILAIGCGHGSSSYLPTAPTGTVGVAGVTAKDSAVPTSNQQFSVALKGGNGHGNEGNKGRDNGDAAEADKVNESGFPGHRGMLSGFVTDVGDDWIEIRGIRVNITEDTVIRHGHRILEIDDIHQGDHAQARGTREDDTLVASEIKVQDTGNDNDDEDEGEEKDED